MKTTHDISISLSDAELAAIRGGDTFARDFGQFIGGTLGYVHDNALLCATATMILPPAGLLMAIAAGVKTAVEN